MFAHRELQVGDPAAMLVLVAHTEAVHLKHPRCWKLKEIENRRAAVKQGWTL